MSLRLPRRTAVVLLLGSAVAAAQGPVCAPSQVPLERRLRQVSLDLLGRPPTLEEYRAVQAKGALDDAALKALVRTEEFYERMKQYHRALLRSNVSQVVFNNGDTRLQVTTDGLKPLELRGNPSSSLRGRNNTGCDHFIEQDQCNAARQDPLLEPATKTCRDAQGVPLPVSVDYSPDQYACTLLTGPADCAEAISTGLVPLKHSFYCDLRRLSSGALAPHLCLPDPAKPQTAALTQEVLDGSGRVIAFVNPAPTNGTLVRLDRCGLDLVQTGGVRGRWAAQPGCVHREGVVQAPPPPWDASGAATVAVCAIEAQARAVNPWTQESCETSRFLQDRSCGCGVGMRRCESGDGAVHQARLAALNEEPLRLIDSVLRRDEDYLSVLTTRRGFVNGPLSQLYRRNMSPTVLPITAPGEPATIPDVPLASADTWAEYTRGPHHSGVLTTPQWLLRFPTQRARVNQFYSAFLCKHFAPPAGATPPNPEDSCNRENNLSKRCGCSACHQTIEPVGAHWGRFGERNATWLDPARFPRFDARCRDCALAGDTTCNGECANYVMQAWDGDGANDLGLLKTYLYRTPDEEPNITGGPRLLVDRVLRSGELEACAVRSLWAELLGRPMTAQEEQRYLPQLAAAFAESGHDFKGLVLRLVGTDAYWRVD